MTELKERAERVAELEEALRWYAVIGTAISPDGLVTIHDAGKLARSVLNKETNRG